MSNEQVPVTRKTNVRMLLNDDVHYPTTATTNGQESSQNSKEITTTNSNGKGSPRIRKEVAVFKSPEPTQEAPAKSNNNPTTSKASTEQAAKNSKQTKKTTSKTTPKDKPYPTPQDRKSTRLNSSHAALS